MSLCALLVLGTIVQVFGKDIPFLATEKTSQTTTSTDGYEMKDVCIFGQVTTVECDEKCAEVEMESYCYKGTNECLCRPRRNPLISLFTGDQEDSDDDHSKPTDQELTDISEESNHTSRPFTIMLTDFIRMEPFFPETQDEEEFDDDDEEEVNNKPSSAMDSNAVPISDHSLSLWSKELFAMALILAMILALVAAELVIVCKKRSKNTNYLHNLFQSVPMDEKLVTVFK